MPGLTPYWMTKVTDAEDNVSRERYLTFMKDSGAAGCVDRELRPNLITSWTNTNYDTFTTTANVISSAQYTTSGTQTAASNSITVVNGRKYILKYNLKPNSGIRPTLSISGGTFSGGGTSAQLLTGTNYKHITASSTSIILTLTNTAATNYYCDFDFYIGNLLTTWTNDTYDGLSFKTQPKIDWAQNNSGAAACHSNTITTTLGGKYCFKYVLARLPSPGGSPLDSERPYLTGTNGLSETQLLDGGNMISWTASGTSTVLTLSNTTSSRFQLLQCYVYPAEARPEITTDLQGVWIYPTGSDAPFSEDVKNGAVSFTWSNDSSPYNYTSFAASGTSITSAVESTTGATSRAKSSTVGLLRTCDYEFSYILTLNNGVATTPMLEVVNATTGKAFKSLALSVGGTTSAPLKVTWTDNRGVANDSQVYLRLVTTTNADYSLTCELTRVSNNVNFKWYDGSETTYEWHTGTEAEYDTFTIGTNTRNIDSAIETTGDGSAAITNGIYLTSGKIYRLTATLTLNSGEAPALAGIYDPEDDLAQVFAAQTLLEGENYILWTSSRTKTYLKLTNTSATNFVCTFTIKEHQVNVTKEPMASILQKNANVYNPVTNSWTTVTSPQYPIHFVLNRDMVRSFLSVASVRAIFVAGSSVYRFWMNAGGSYYTNDGTITEITDAYTEFLSVFTAYSMNTATYCPGIVWDYEYVEPVRQRGGDTHPIYYPTKYTLGFDGGVNEPTVGLDNDAEDGLDSATNVAIKITGATSGAYGYPKYVIASGGSWAGDNAEGTLYLHGVSGTFEDDEDLYQDYGGAGETFIAKATGAAAAVTVTDLKAITTDITGKLSTAVRTGLGKKIVLCTTVSIGDGVSIPTVTSDTATDNDFAGNAGLIGNMGLDPAAVSSVCDAMMPQLYFQWHSKGDSGAFENAVKEWIVKYLNWIKVCSVPVIPLMAHQTTNEKTTQAIAMGLDVWNYYGAWRLKALGIWGTSVNLWKDSSMTSTANTIRAMAFLVYQGVYSGPLTGTAYGFYPFRANDKDYFSYAEA